MRDRRLLAGPQERPAKSWVRGDQREGQTGRALTTVFKKARAVTDVAFPAGATTDEKCDLLLASFNDLLLKLRDSQQMDKA